jgi:hypothetical protein
MFMILTVGVPTVALAQESTVVATPASAADAATSKASVNDEVPTRLGLLKTRINPELGVSSFEYSGVSGGSKQGLSGGVTAEFGEGMRRLETGLMLIQSGGNANVDGEVSAIHSTYLTIPIMAKIRVAQLTAQSWFLKGGMMTAFQTAGGDRDASNAIDMMLSLGAAGRFAFTRNMDFIVDATYNRGLFEAVRTSASTSNYNQGVLVLAGVSIQI